MGSSRLSRVGFGVTPRQSFDWAAPGSEERCSKKARETGVLPFWSEFGSSDDTRWDKP